MPVIFELAASGKIQDLIMAQIHISFLPWVVPIVCRTHHVAVTEEAFGLAATFRS